MIAILNADARRLPLADESVNCCVTSPPYWGLRDYGLDPQVWGGDPDCDHAFGHEGRRNRGGPMKIKRETFTSAELARITRATTAQISRLERAGVLKPVTKGLGRGKQHLFDVRGVQTAALAIYIGKNTRTPASEIAKIVAYLNRRRLGWNGPPVEMTAHYDGQGRVRIEAIGKRGDPIRATIDVRAITSPVLRGMRLLLLVRSLRRDP